MSPAFEAVFWGLISVVPWRWVSSWLFCQGAQPRRGGYHGFRGSRGGHHGNRLLGVAFLYAAANRLLADFGAKHRKRSGCQQPKVDEDGGYGVAIAVGALLDGIPRSIAIGLSFLHRGAVSIATLAAIILSNLSEGLSSSTGMRKAGRLSAYVFGIWTSIAVACGFTSLTGFVGFDVFHRLS